jgi:heat shock protein HslJ/uncharacterized lipoprotein YbaY
MQSRLASLSTAGVVFLAGCAGPATAPEPSTFVVAGELVSRVRIALPSDGQAIVELRADNDPKAAVVAEQRIDLQGRQTPIAFELKVDRTRLTPAERYAVRGGVHTSGRFAWVTDPVLVDTSGARAAAEELLLKPVQPLAFATTFNCGGHRVRVGFRRDTMLIALQNRTIELKPVPAASGARYEAVDDATTGFWNKGDRATLTLRGRTYPECVEAKVTLPLRATGNEPSWRLDVTTASMTLLTDFGTGRLEASAPAVERFDDATQFSARAGTADLVATVADRVCMDTMSGMPHPYVVTVRTGGRVWHGCGGEPRSLLTGREWVVEDLDGRGIIDRSRMTLNFDENGQLSGRAGCNTYTGRYVLTGEGLSVVDVAVTQKACAPSLIEQEARFLAVLAAVDRFEITTEGALVLRGPARSMLARF